MSEARTALITGGARRIGEAIARDLSANGWRVAIHYNTSPEDALELCEHLENSVTVRADLADWDQTATLYKRAKEKLGGLDLIVNNASVFEPDEVDALDRVKWRDHFAVHLQAPALLAEAMATDPSDHDRLIVNLIDQRVWALTPRFFSYTLSKSALWTATRTMAQGLADKNIRVNAIGPGPTLPNERQTPEDFEQQTNALPLRRGPELREFGETVRYLWNAKSVTGQMIALDGGQHLAWETPDVSGIAE
jgi:NAD(P)-dependent dehydrogenase (short-subunit alcohol dehydrogenase family)